MGFIQSKDIGIHVSKKKTICIKYFFINKNGDWDTMYLEMSRELIEDLNIAQEIVDSEL